MAKKKKKLVPNKDGIVTLKNGVKAKVLASGKLKFIKKK